jgi:peroxin-5
MARQFFEGNSQGSNAGPFFAMPHHLPSAEMVGMGEMNGKAGMDFNDAWAKEQKFHNLAGDGTAQAAWAAEFGSGLRQSILGPSTQHEIGGRSDCK